jgi:tRNA(adenine34) deaminase
MIYQYSNQNNKDDEKWMKLAIKEAMHAKDEDEVPVGAVIVKDNILIATAYNQPISKNDPTAHAEIQLLRSAGKYLQNYRLINCTIYVTLEPCLMCFGAMIHARIKRIVFGAYEHKDNECAYCRNNTHMKNLNHKLIINGGILEKECQKIIQKFFINKRK